jgi:hypothetical protein
VTERAAMQVYIECVCGKKYDVDRTQVNKFECEGCGRALTVPAPQLVKELDALRARMQQGEPGMRDAMKQAIEMRNPHVVPLIMQGAQSGQREAVNIALVGLADFPGTGQEVLASWLTGGELSVARLVSAFREQGYKPGADYLCVLINNGKLKESQIAEAAGYLGESGSEGALHTLKEQRRKFPNLSGILDDALARLRHLDDNAGGIPDEAKQIPGRASARVSARDEAPARKKGCMGLLLAVAAAVGMVLAIAAIAGWNV